MNFTTKAIEYLKRTKKLIEMKLSNRNLKEYIPEHSLFKLIQALSKLNKTGNQNLGSENWKLMTIHMRDEVNKLNIIRERRLTSICNIIDW